MSKHYVSNIFGRSPFATSLSMAIAISCSIFSLIVNILPVTAQTSPVASDADRKAQTQIYLSQAQSLFDQGLYDRSMMFVNQAIDASPNNPLAWQLLGNCLKKIGRDREALTAYDQAVKLLSIPNVAIAPTFPNAPVLVQPNSQGNNDIGQLWIERARTLERLNRFQESVTAYDQALKIRCQEQAQKTNEVLPTVCQAYLFTVNPPNNLPANANQNSNQNPNQNSNQNATRNTVIVPVSPQPTPSKNNRGIW